MIEIELLELIKKIQDMKAETQTVEVKAAHHGCPKRLYDTLSAFSNQDSGGVLIFGRDETNDFQSVGVYDVQDLHKKVNEQCKQMVPPIRPIFTSVRYGSGYIVSAEIPATDVTERPCYYGGVGRTKGSYVRSGDSDEPMTDYEIYSYEAFRKKYQDDIRVNEKADMTTIDMSALNRYIQLVKDKNPNLSKLPDQDVFRFLNIVIDGKPTLTCTLLFSLYPQMSYPQYTINAMVVPGYERGDVGPDGSRFSDNLRIEGTIPEVLEQALKFLHSNLKIKTIIDPSTGYRADKYEYPMIALREALLNSLVHRDYSFHTEAMPIELIIYKDRLEIRNPGGLYGRLSIDKLGKVQPDTRNPVLARALETLGITENRYSGIPTIRRELKQAGMRDAEFMDSRSEFCVTFYNGVQREVHFTDRTEEQDLLEFCREPRSRKEIADYLGIATIYYVSQNYINPLLESGQLKMTIPEHPKSRNQRFYRG